MYRIKTIFILLCLLLGGLGIVSAQPETCQPANCSVGVLEPGGSYTGLDGITIKSSKYQDKALTVYIERIEDTSDLPPLSWAKDTPLKAETPYYRIGATEYYHLPSGAAFSIGVPVPAGVAPEGLADFGFNITTSPGLSPLPPPGGNGPIPEEIPAGYAYWISRPTRYDSETNQVFLPRGGLSIDGDIFTIVSGAYRK